MDPDFSTEIDGSLHSTLTTMPALLRSPRLPLEVVSEHEEPLSGAIGKDDGQASFVQHSRCRRWRLSQSTLRRDKVLLV